MRLLDLFFIIIFSVTAMNALFMSGVMAFRGSARKDLDRLTALLILLFGLRLSKEVGIFFYPDLHLAYHAIWFTAIVFSGALFFIYIRSWLKGPPGRNLIASHLFVPALFMVLQFIFPQRLHTGEIYRASIIYMDLYITLAVLELVRSEVPHRGWATGFVVFFGLEALTFTLNIFYLFKITRIEAFLFCAALYLFIFVELKYKLSREVYRRAVRKEEGDDSLFRDLLVIMDERKPYLVPDLTLAGLSTLMESTPRTVSRLINSNSTGNFNDFVNSYRIKEVKKRFAAGDDKNMTIAAIAQECGFRSLSVFNPAFKKTAGMTPTKYIKTLSRT